MRRRSIRRSSRITTRLSANSISHVANSIALLAQQQRYEALASGERLEALAPPTSWRAALRGQWVSGSMGRAGGGTVAACSRRGGLRKDA